MTISVEIKKLRQKVFLSQENFAKTVGVTDPTVNRWEMRANKFI